MSCIRSFTRQLVFYLSGLVLILFLLLVVPINGQSPALAISSSTSSVSSITIPIPATTLDPPENLWDQYGLVAVFVSILSLILGGLLRPVVDDWGERLQERLRGDNRRFRDRYVAALAAAHRYLKLVGIHGREGIPPPLLREVYVSLRMGGAGTGLDEARTVSITEAFSVHTCLLILGEPGAGKSTLMDWLTLVFANRISHPTLRRGRDLLPVFLPLRNCVGDQRPLHELMGDPALLPMNIHPPKSFFLSALERGRCLVLLDGLDEVIDERQRASAANKINELVRTYPDNHYVVTCRTAGWKEGLLTGDFARLYVRDFDDADIVRFIGGWYRAVRTRQVALRGDLSTDDRLLEMKQAEEKAEKESARLLEALNRNQSLYRLARNPLILSLIALVHYRRTRLPQGRVKLYQECLEILLETWDNEDKELEIVGPSLGAKEAILREIAYYFHSRGLAEMERRELKSLIAPLLLRLDCPTDAAETLRQIEERSGILVSRGINRYVFAHRTLQEYLVARVLASSPQRARGLMTHLNEEPWREVILLYSGLIGEWATALLEAILSQPDDAAHNLLILAGECLAEDVQVSPETRNKIIERLEAVFRSTTDPLAFVRLGETLAVLGDEDVVALFGRVLERGNLVQQKVAARTLGQLGARTSDPAAIAARLCTTLGVADASLRQTAALALVDLGQTDVETVTALKHARRDDVPKVRAAAICALLELGKLQNIASASADVVCALGKVGVHTKNPRIVATHLRDILNSRSAVLRRASALALADLGQIDAGIVAALERARQDPDYDVRVAALWALLELGAAAEDMVKVPAGEFIMSEGTSKHTLYLPDYYITRTPVTNVQFSRFIEAGGYRRQELWTRAGWRRKEERGWEQPHFWTNRRWNRPAQPVVGISWYEALAYARWFDGKLPSEAKWEKAASWDPRTGRKRRYPWGGEFDKRKCNTVESGVRATTPVGKYSPAGDSAYGCADMAGNVWEWTCSVYERYPYRTDDGREDVTSFGPRVLRGGSFDYHARGARPVSRMRNDPYVRSGVSGVRVVVTAPFSSIDL